MAIASRWIDRPFAGFLMNERMVPGNVGRYEWTGTQAGLRYPDKILAVNGRPVASIYFTVPSGSTIGSGCA